jgi:antitoxin (DNA-binding transcriptional repressor) of toxin-antitoxin stability system
LSEYVRLVAAGETVLVTDRDRVVAELVPPRAGRSPLVTDALLAEAVRQGLITPHALPRSDQLPVRKPVAKLAVILRELDRDRGER